MKKKIQLSIMFAAICTVLMAQPPAGYYDSAFGKKKEALKTAMKGIIQSHEAISYKELWTAFITTDNKGNNIVWDIYSDNPTGTPPYIYHYTNNQCGNYTKEADCYNREHSMPASWFNDGTPMYTDLFHIYPTDGWVNNKRGNYPYGEVSNPTWTSKNGSKLGNCSVSGYSKTAFEPIDAYKGDLARTYFYMVTCYEDKIEGWTDTEAMQMLNATKYPSFQAWVIPMLLKWHRQDPVSQKEIDRNNAIFQYQENRNPYIDYPQLAEYIWGDSINYVFDPTAPPLEMKGTEITPPSILVADGALHIENISNEAIIQLYNMCGQLITKTQPVAGTYTVALFHDRFYIVCITDNSGNSWAYKIINDK